MQNKFLIQVASVAVLLAFIVVMLGAYTRLTDAGLGCPDWPGCYGKMVLPSANNALQKAQLHYPNIPIESHKAWTEMIHRYAAGTLALLIFFMASFVAIKRYQGSRLPIILPLILTLLVVFQALLGMWTVTLKLLPVVVMGHLLGGMLIIACLSRFRVQLTALIGNNDTRWRPWLRLGVLIVFIQIALGGWVSSNYAGIACIGFPTCNGVWLPDLHWTRGFNLFSAVGLNYQGGLLDRDLRVTIQYIHRLGAVITFLYISGLAFLILLKSKMHTLRTGAKLMVTLVCVQFLLGIINVVYLLPLKIAVAHNGVAALLLATVFSLLHFTRGESTDAC